jgi:hypothetical protein
MLAFRGTAFLKALPYVMGVGLLFVAGVALSYNYDLRVGVEQRGSRLNDVGYVPSYARQSGPQILMVYVGSSTCPWSNLPEVPPAVETIKTRLADYALDRGLSFKALGVALDWSAQRGFQHLSKFGLFDEVSAGYSWGNSVAMRYLGLDGSVPVATPVILVYQQSFVAPRDSGDSGAYEERDRRTLLVKRGNQEITDWANSAVTLEDGQVMDAQTSAGSK